MNILAIIIKNTATLDYVAPLLCIAKKDYPNLNVSVLYCRLHKQEMLKTSDYYSSLFRKFKVNEYDLSCFLNKPHLYMLNFIDFINSLNTRILSPFYSKFVNYISSKIDYQKALKSLDPHTILADNTESRKEIAEQLAQYIKKNNIKTVLLPHAPHHTNTSGFYALGLKNILPDNYEYWISFKYDNSSNVDPRLKQRFPYIGYPGLDSRWLDMLSSRRTSVPSNLNLRCLFIVRRFLLKNQERTPGDNVFVYSYEEFSALLRRVSLALLEYNENIEVIVKPHPSNNLSDLQCALNETGNNHWKITTEPIYKLAPEVDFCISLYSTVFFVPSAMGIPVILLNTSTQEFVNKDINLRKLYAGFSLYLDDNALLESTLNKVLKIVNGKRHHCSIAISDIEHIRHYYPDGAIERAINQLRIPSGDIKASS